MSSNTPSHLDDLDINNADDKVALRLFQGYLWYPQDMTITLTEYLPKQLDDTIHLLWDEIRPPFTFFDDGTLSSSQVFYQLTVAYVGEKQPSTYWDTALPELETKLAPLLHTMPANVGWQLLSDLRPL